MRKIHTIPVSLAVDRSLKLLSLDIAVVFNIINDSILNVLQTWAVLGIHFKEGHLVFICKLPASFYLGMLANIICLHWIRAKEFKWDAWGVFEVNLFDVVESLGPRLVIHVDDNVALAQVLAITFVVVGIGGHIVPTNPPGLVLTVHQALRVCIRLGLTACADPIREQVLEDGRFARVLGAQDHDPRVRLHFLLLPRGLWRLGGLGVALAVGVGLFVSHFYKF